MHDIFQNIFPFLISAAFPLPFKVRVLEDFQVLIRRQIPELSQAIIIVIIIILLIFPIDNSVRDVRIHVR